MTQDFFWFIQKKSRSLTPPLFPYWNNPKQSWMDPEHGVLSQSTGSKKQAINALKSIGTFQKKDIGLDPDKTKLMKSIGIEPDLQLFQYLCPTKAPIN